MRYIGGGGRETIVAKARFRSAGNSWKANENENVLHGGKWKKVERGILILVKELVIFSIKGKIGPNWIDPIFELFVPSLPKE